MPAFDAAASAGTGAINAASLTYTHTCTGSGLVLVVGVAASAAPTNITYAGVPLIRISTDVSNTAFNSMWYLANPTVGANNVIVTMASSQTILAGSISVTGASQTDPVNFVSLTKATNTSISTIISPTKNNCILIDNLAIAANTTPTAGGSQTQEVSQQSSIGFGQGMSYQILSGNPATSLSWSWVSTGVTAYRIIAIASPILNIPKPNNLRPHPFSPGLAR